MGNYASCTPSAHDGKHSRTMKVIFPGGELRQFHGPLYAAELMLDAPNHFMVSTHSMQVGRRFSPLSADEELEAGGFYVMLPIKRVNSVATAEDMGRPWMAMAAGPESARGSGGSVRIQPESVQGSPEMCDPVGAGWGSEAPTPSLESAPTGEFLDRLRLCRPRKPVLETIKE